MDAYHANADHGLIGDLQTAALVAKDGTIDWFACRLMIRRACSPRCWTGRRAGSSGGPSVSERRPGCRPAGGVILHRDVVGGPCIHHEIDEAPGLFGLLAADEQQRVPLENLPDQVGVLRVPRRFGVEFTVFGAPVRTVECGGQTNLGFGETQPEHVGLDARHEVEHVPGQRLEVDGDLRRISGECCRASAAYRRARTWRAGG
jgi:hypothetical protein